MILDPMSLSTPSLGITKEPDFDAVGIDARLSTPSLGITVRYYLCWEVGGGDGAFNSLSRDHRPADPHHARDRRLGLSTPSLGITWAVAERFPIEIEFRLSTPSLGITEPDSGIFRLSAAFCRGTPSHK